MHYTRQHPPLVNLNRVQWGDSLTLISQMPDRSIGSIISDPPFFTGIGRDDGGFGNDPWVNAPELRTNGDELHPLQVLSAWTFNYMEQFARAVRRGGAVVVMCGAHAAAAWMNAADKAGLMWMAEIDVLWNTGKVRAHNFGSLHTHILWFAVPGARHTWNSRRKAIYSNLLVARKVPLHLRLHAAQKPIELTNFLVSLLSRPDDVVVDPFCGSGSTLVSAELCGRPWIGMDKDAKNCQIARHRVGNAEVEDDFPLYLWINNRLEQV